MNRTLFDDYIARFNRKDFTAFNDYIAEDLHMQNGTLEVNGRQSMKAHYAKIWQDFTEELFPSDFVFSDENAAIRMYTRFTAEHDAPNSLFGPVSAGTRFEFRGVISYRLNADGQFCDILVAYNSFRRIDVGGTVAELGIPH